MGMCFVGSMFVVLATCVPEAVVSRGALRMGAVDLAFGNILGSNLFNIAILAVDDLFFRQGPLLSHVSRGHAITAAAGVTMTADVTASLLLYFGQ